MTLPQNVKDAVKCPIAVERCMVIMDSHADAMAAWQTIRAHLMSKEASIANLRSAAHKAVLANADLRVRHELVESRLAAANALLRKIGKMADGTLCDEVRDYLQGAGDEAV